MPHKLQRLLLSISLVKAFDVFCSFFVLGQIIVVETGAPIGLIIAGVVCSLLVIVAAIFVVVCMRRRRRNNKIKKEQEKKKRELEVKSIKILFHFSYLNFRNFYSKVKHLVYLIKLCYKNDMSKTWKWGKLTWGLLSSYVRK